MMENTTWYDKLSSILSYGPSRKNICRNNAAAIAADSERDIDNERIFWDLYCEEKYRIEEKIPLVTRFFSEIKRHCLALFQPIPFTSDKFWIEYLQKSFRFSFYVLSLNIVVLTSASLFIISKSQRHQKNYELYEVYRGIALDMLIWVVMSSIILITLVRIKLLHISEISQYVGLWNDVGKLILFIRGLQVWMTIRDFMILDVGGCSDKSSSFWKYPSMLLWLHSIASHLLSTQLFPWPWAMIFFALMYCEQIVVLSTCTIFFENMPESLKIFIASTFFYAIFGASFVSGGNACYSFTSDIC
jgi:hypothetical protein